MGTLTNVRTLCDKLGKKHRELKGIVPASAEVTTWRVSQGDLRIFREDMNGHSSPDYTPYHKEVIEVSYQGKLVYQVRTNFGFASEYPKVTRYETGEWESEVESLLEE